MELHSYFYDSKLVILALLKKKKALSASQSFALKNYFVTSWFQPQVSEVMKTLHVLAYQQSDIETMSIRATATPKNEQHALAPFTTF